MAGVKRGKSEDSKRHHKPGQRLDDPGMSDFVAQEITRCKLRMSRRTENSVIYVVNI